MSKASKRMVGIAAGAAAGMATAYGFTRYRRDLTAAYGRLEEGWQLLETSAGPVQVAIRGEGFPVLSVHGVGGGWDHGLYSARALDNRFRIIAPSRFGYLKTPLPEQTSPEVQADAHAAVLDALNIERAVMVGASGGGPSAIQFAVRHPDRCAALVLFCAVTRPVHAQALKTAFQVLYSSDLALWLLRSLVVLPSMGSSVQATDATLAAAAKEQAQEFLKLLLPAQPRQPGVHNDIEVLQSFPLLPLERVRTPTLIVHAADDTTVPVYHGRGASASIPGADYLELEYGGHLLLYDQERIRRRVANFLDQALNTG